MEFAFPNPHDEQTLSKIRGATDECQTRIFANPLAVASSRPILKVIEPATLI